jgi:hypothetical protein
MVNVILCAAAIGYWLRSRKTGFAWIAAAFGTCAIQPIFRPLLLWAELRFSPAARQLLLLPFYILFLVFMLIGFHSFFAQRSMGHKMTDHEGEPYSWVSIKRVGFGAAGVLMLVLSVSSLICSFVRRMSGQGGADHYLGVGFGAFVAGLMCLGLVFHKRSPLRVPIDDSSR